MQLIAEIGCVFGDLLRCSAEALGSSCMLDTCCVVQFELNGGEPVGTSIPATEHSVMTAWHTEKAAIENMIDCFGDGLFACVMDSYDYMRVSHAQRA